VLERGEGTAEPKTNPAGWHPHWRRMGS